MSISSGTLRPSRIPASLLLASTAGIISPACATVCPKGIGGCPYPGRCFLFTDIDANAACDYTGRLVGNVEPPAGTNALVPTGTATPAPVLPSADLPAVLAPSAGGGVQGPPDAILGGVISFIASHPVAIALAVFAVVTGLTIFLLWKGPFRQKNTTLAPVTAFSLILGLGAALITGCLMTAGIGGGTTFALMYLLPVTFLTAYLWSHNGLTKTWSVAILVMSVLTGLVFGAPVMPLYFTGFVGLLTGNAVIAPGIAGLSVVIVLTLFFGRSFCGHVCPVGAVQELAYTLPLKKRKLSPGYLPEIVRGIFCLVALAAAPVYLSVIGALGVDAFYSLTVSSALLVFLGILVIAAVVYRPLCRFICPFGLIFSLPAHFSRYRIRTRDPCVGCGLCEKACPVGAARKDVSKRECYLCGRCVAACRVPGAIGYATGTVSGGTRPTKSPVSLSNHPAEERL